jgi:predicted phosphoribosyltransferase
VVASRTDSSTSSAKRIAIALVDRSIATGSSMVWAVSVLKSRCGIWECVSPRRLSQQ